MNRWEGSRKLTPGRWWYKYCNITEFSLVFNVAGYWQFNGQSVVYVTFPALIAVVIGA